MIQAICFDMDGVLLNTEPLGAQVLMEAASRQHVTLSEDQQKTLVGANMQDTRGWLNLWFGEKVNADQYTEDWCALMLSHIEQDGVPTMPEAENTLRKVRQMGLKLSLCTSNAKPVVMDYLTRLGWTDLFDHVITGEMVENGKPAPDIYRLGAEKMGVRPENCLGVEDSINGIRALRAAGMRSVMIPDTMPYTEALRPYVDVLLPNLSALQKEIQNEVNKKKE